MIGVVILGVESSLVSIGGFSLLNTGIYRKQKMLGVRSKI